VCLQKNFILTTYFTIYFSFSQIVLFFSIYNHYSTSTFQLQQKPIDGLSIGFNMISIDCKGDAEKVYHASCGGAVGARGHIIYKPQRG
jgi:hypothetical protein